LAADEINSGILILAHIKCHLNEGDSGTGSVIFKIRVGESATPTSNTLVDTYNPKVYQLNSGGDIQDSRVQLYFDQTITGLYTLADWTNINFVHITATLSMPPSSGNGSAECIDINVIGI